MQRLVLVLLPITAAIVVVIGGFYIWTGVRLLLAGNTPAGLAFAAFGVGGLILAGALWSLRAMLRSRPPAAGGPT